MKKRRDGWQADLDLWNDFWRSLASGFAARTASTTSSTARFTYMPSTASSMTGGTVVLTVPRTTVYVSTTIVSTTFVTVPGATVTVPPASLGSSGRNSLQETSSVSATRGLSSEMSSFFPSGVTGDPSTAPMATPTSSSANSTTDSIIGAQSDDQTQKHTIIGGLSGSIAGLIFIGLLVCLALRLRRKKDESLESSDSMSEKGVRPAIVRKWTQLTGGVAGSPKQIDQVERSATPVKVDEDHRIIRMSTRHWPRPFAAGVGDGYRESQPPGTLRVVNPDLSRPDTPRESTDTALGHFMKQRPSLAGFVYGVSRQSPGAKLQKYPAARKPIPTITVIDPNLSRECITTYDRTPSFRSYPSIASTQVVSQHPPDDPFTSPRRPPPIRHKETTNPSTPPIGRPRNPTPQPNTAGGKPWTNLLHPLFTKRSSNAETPQNVRGLSHFSISSSASRSSRRSDPFDLSVRGSHAPREASGFRRGSLKSNWILYEGT